MRLSHSAGTSSNPAANTSSRRAAIGRSPPCLLRRQTWSITSGKTPSTVKACGCKRPSIRGPQTTVQPTNRMQSLKTRSSRSWARRIGLREGSSSNSKCPLSMPCPSGRSHRCLLTCQYLRISFYHRTRRSCSGLDSPQMIRSGALWSSRSLSNR